MTVKSWLKPALENHDEPENNSLAEVPSESLESELIEVSGQDRAIEELAADGEELREDQEKLDQITENAEASLEQGGMDETAAKQTAVAAESFTAKWGVKVRKVATESFGSSDGRLSATKVAVEGLKDSAKEMWDRFIEWLKQMIEKAKGLFNKLTDAGGRMIKRGEKLKKALKDGLGEKDEDKVKGGFIKKLYVDEKFDFETAMGIVKSIAEGGAKKAGQAVDVVAEEAGKLARGEKAEGSDEISKAAESFGDKVSKKMQVPSGAEDVVVRAVTGNAYIITYTDKDGVGMMKYQKPGVDKPDSDVETLSEDKMSDGVEVVIAAGTALRDELKGFTNANAKLEKAMASFKKAKDDLDKAGESDKDEKKTNLEKARAKIQTVEATQRVVSNVLTDGGSGIADYVAASIKAHKKAS
jgi:hypothetical protein